MVPRRARALLDDVAGTGRCLFVQCPPGFGAADVAQAWALQVGERAPAIRVLDADTAQPTTDDVSEWLRRITVPNVIAIAQVVGDVAVPAGWHAAGPSDLVFEPDEIEALIDNPHTGDAIAAGVETQTAGWPALVHLAVSTLNAPMARGLTGSADLSADAVRRAVREHLTRELVPALPSDWYPLLEYLSVAGDSSSSEFDSAASDHPAPHAAVLGLTATAQVGKASVLRLLPGLADIVIAAIERNAPERLTRLRREIATRRRDLGLVDCGIAAAYAIPDWDLCASILDRWWMERYFVGPYRDLAAQAALAIPQSYLGRYRALAHRAEAFRLVALGSFPVEIRTGTQAIHEEFRRDGGGEMLRVGFNALTGRRYWGRLAEARDIALRVAPQADLVTLRSAPTAGMMTLWYLHAGMACQLAGDDASARRLYRAGWLARTWDTSGFATKDLAAKNAVLVAFRGETAQAHEWLRESHALPDCGDFVDRTIRSSATIAETMLALDRLDSDCATKLLGGIDGLVSREELWPYSVWNRARHEMFNSNPLGVLQLVEDARHDWSDTASFPDFHAPLLSVLTADARLALGHGTSAGIELQSVPDSFVPGWASHVRLHLLTGRPDVAVTRANYYAARLDITPRAATELAVLLSAALIATGELRAAESAARKAELLVERHRIASALLGIPTELAEQVVWFAPALARYLPTIYRVAAYPTQAEIIDLTERELLVLRGLLDGLLKEDIALRLFVSPNTVKTQIRSLYAKLAVHSRAAAVARATELGLVPRTGVTPQSPPPVDARPLLSRPNTMRRNRSS